MESSENHVWSDLIIHTDTRIEGDGTGLGLAFVPLRPMRNYQVVLSILGSWPTIAVLVRQGFSHS